MKFIFNFLNKRGTIFLIGAIVFGAYLNSLNNGFVLDDPSQVTNNPNVQSISNIPRLFLGSTFAGGANLEGVYYKPLMTSTYAIIYDFFGVNPVPYHVLQLLLHISNSIIVFLIFRKIFSSIRHPGGSETTDKQSLLSGESRILNRRDSIASFQNDSGLVPLFLALVFAVHPLNNESVVYISALQEPLFFFFGSLAFLVVVSIRHSGLDPESKRMDSRFRGNDRERDKGQLSIVKYLLFGVLIFLSLLSKETGVLFLAISIVYVFFFSSNMSLRGALRLRSGRRSNLKRGREGIASLISFARNDKGVRLMAVSVLVFGAYVVLRHFAVGLPVSKDLPYPIMRLPLIWRVLNIPEEIFYYLRNFFLPWDIAVAQHWVVRSLSFSGFWLPLAVVGAFFAGLGAYGRYLLSTVNSYSSSERKRVEKHVILSVAKDLDSSSSTQNDKIESSRQARTVKTFTFFFIWFVLGLGLHMNVVPLDVTVADRWFYFPIVGLLGMIGVAIPVIPHLMRDPELDSRFRGNDNKKGGKIALILLSAAIVSILSARTVVRNADWKDGLTLALRDIKYSRDSFPLENNLAFELIGAKRWEEAEIHAKRSTELGPWWWLNWNNLGVIYRHKAMVDPRYIDRAVDAFKKATENTDTFYMPYENLAEFLVFYKSPEDASEFIVESSKKLNPSARLWFLLAVSQYQIGDKQGAQNAVYRAKLLEPGNETFVRFYQALAGNQQVKFEKPFY